MKRTRVARAAAFATVVATALLPRRAAAEPSPHTFGLAITIANAPPEEISARATQRLPDGRVPRLERRVVDDAWIGKQVDAANGLFGLIGVTFRWTLEKVLPDTNAEMHTRSDRDALTPLTEPGVIDVFVVRALEDVDEPGRYRRGVCWTGRGGKRFIVLSRIAPPTVLAHELGHFFGNPHSTEKNNVMSYDRDGGSIFFDERQAATTARFSREFFASGRLFDVGPARRR